MRPADGSPAASRDGAPVSADAPGPSGPPRRLRCPHCPAAATLVVRGSDGVSSRAVAVCAAHEARARRWCAPAGPVTVAPLPGRPVWRQLTLDGTDAPVRWPS
jgi:hypothetical protein